MQLVFSNQKTPTTITSSMFLAGPTPRDSSVVDWRKEAVEILENLKYKGVVFIPCPDFVWNDEKNNLTGKWNYDEQCAWEVLHREIADQIVFWVPRDIQGGMPAFTTNVEFGEDLSSEKMVYGRPENAEKCRYLDLRVKSIDNPIFNDLSVMLTEVVSKLGEGFIRKDGEVNIPIHIWNTPQFQGWYKDLKNAGNSLLDAKVLSTFKVWNNIFAYALWVKVYIKDEERIKQSEIVFSRPDISTVVAYFKDDKDVFIALVKEFRSNVSNKSGYVLELPGGSSLNAAFAPEKVAQHELVEETSLYIKDVSRFKFCGVKQLASTFTSFKNHIYKVELNRDEFLQLKSFSDENKVFGESDDEKTQVVILNIKDILDSDMDLSVVGSIYYALSNDMK